MEQIYLVIVNKSDAYEDTTSVFPCKTFKAAKRKYNSEFRDSATEALAYYDTDANSFTTEEMDGNLRELDSILHFNEEFDSENGQWLDVAVIHWGNANKRVHRIEITKSKIYE